MKHIFTLAFIAFSFFAFAKYQGQSPIVSQQDFLKQKENYLVVDVRTPEEFANGHIPTAVNMPLNDLEKYLQQLSSSEKPILVYCRSGRRAWVAEQQMIKAGINNVFHLEGDMNSWQASQHPISQP
jgi:rhodanese-related sulfurtransferase